MTTINLMTQELLGAVGQGKMSSLAYDTAWVARLGTIHPELSNRALQWICDHQLPDGSWGAAAPIYYHDRVISTLAAMLALTQRGRRARDRVQIDRGLAALDRITTGATQGLMNDLNGATVGFEMIAPTLVSEAEKLGIIRQQGERVLGRLARMRSAKLARIQGRMVNRSVTMAFSAEMAGLDGQQMLDIPNLQEANGSVGHSPSASAYFALYVKPGDARALRYLEQTVENGGAPNLLPFDVYERAWVLWNLDLFPDWDAEVRQSFTPHLDYLQQAWKPGEGVGFSHGYSIPDGDDTIITYELLSRHGYDPDPDAILKFEEPGHFRCYHLEVGISPSVNIHALMALKQMGCGDSHPSVRKIYRFLESAQGPQDFWIDKWHSSPYYTTSHYIIASSHYNRPAARGYVEWLIASQRENGAWGYFMPTAEETAFCLQALSLWQKQTNQVAPDVIRAGLGWLLEHLDPPYPPLWIGKGLYSADHVVRAAILSAVQLARSVL